MGIYLPSGYEPLSAQHIVNRYNEIIDEINQEYYNDYQEYLSSENDELMIKYIPAVDNLRLYINGIHYEEGNHYLLDRERKIITWIFTYENGGFDLSPHYKYLAIYDIYLSDNDLSDIGEIE